MVSVDVKQQKKEKIPRAQELCGQGGGLWLSYSIQSFTVPNEPYVICDRREAH